MRCDDCHDQIEMPLIDYVREREALGAVICSDCRNSSRVQSAAEFYYGAPV